MKTLITSIIGTGAAALVLLAYLALHKQEQLKQEVHVDKARMEVESAKFDKSFEEKWQAFDGKTLPRAEREKHDRRIQAAESDLTTEKKRLAGTDAASARDLAEMKAALDALDRPSQNK